MRTGVSYMGHYNPEHIKTDLEDIKKLDCDDVLLAAQENDFIYFPGKIRFLPQLAKEQGLRPIVIFWGLLNYFGGGRSSQFLLEHPTAHQVQKSGFYYPAGCYNNPDALNHIRTMIDSIAYLGFEGYFIDEPSPINCYCPACKVLFEKTYSSDLETAKENVLLEFRKKCVIRYVDLITKYIKETQPQLETLCCIMPSDSLLWDEVAQIKNLDNLGTDIYWVNDHNDLKEMIPLVENISRRCRENGKKHHQWLQCFGVQKGKELRINEQGEILLQEKPDALYVWAYKGQIGTSEACENPTAAWNAACEILKKAKEE